MTGSEVLSTTVVAPFLSWADSITDMSDVNIYKIK